MGGERKKEQDLKLCILFFFHLLNHSFLSCRYQEADVGDADPYKILKELPIVGHRNAVVRNIAISPSEETLAVTLSDHQVRSLKADDGNQPRLADYFFRL